MSKQVFDFRITIEPLADDFNLEQLTASIVEKINQATPDAEVKFKPNEIDPRVQRIIDVAMDIWCAFGDFGPPGLVSNVFDRAMSIIEEDERRAKLHEFKENLDDILQIPSKQ